MSLWKVFQGNSRLVTPETSTKSRICVWRWKRMQFYRGVNLYPCSLKIRIDFWWYRRFCTLDIWQEWFWRAWLANRALRKLKWLSVKSATGGNTKFLHLFAPDHALGSQISRMARTLNNIYQLKPLIHAAAIRPCPATHNKKRIIVLSRPLFSDPVCLKHLRFSSKLLSSGWGPQAKAAKRDRRRYSGIQWACL